MTAWLVFGDDWGAHPSTTQHLVRALLHEGDRVVWVNGIGMRAPRLSMGDARRVAGRLASLTRRPARRAASKGGGAEAATAFDGLRVVHPLVAPWHKHLSRLNQVLLRSPIRAALGALGASSCHVLIANPMGALYLGDLPTDRVVYLRLDDHPTMPLVDGAHVAAVERRLFDDADLVVATARPLLPAGIGDRGRYLPQGVDLDHFGASSLEPPPSPPRVLGFFGLLEAWIDVDLIAAVAQRRPDWTLELLGRDRLAPSARARLQGIENVRFRDAVPYMNLPTAVEGWHAAWAPFVLSQLTEGVNPLKLREYLALGLPAACTPLPEIEALAPHCVSVRTVDDVSRWLDGVSADDRAARQARRDSVGNDSWGGRAAALRRWVLEPGRSAAREAHAG